MQGKRDSGHNFYAYHHDDFQQKCFELAQEEYEKCENIHIERQCHKLEQQFFII